MCKTYNKPAIKVVTLQQRHHLLNTSNGTKGEISGYSKASSGFSQEGEVKEQSNNSIWDDEWSK